jgi:hypothetical protein
MTTRSLVLADINGRVIAGAQPFGNFRRVIEEEIKK